MDNTVELIGHYGGDESHALSAWTSTRRELDDDRKSRMGAMLRNLAEQGHHTPFEKSYLHFLVMCDTASHIHLLKHRIGVSVNAESARYKELKDDKYYIPDDWSWPHTPGDDWQFVLQDHMKRSLELYHQCLYSLSPHLGRKRAKESARLFLPYANQLTLDVGFNFRSFMHFQGLRNKPDAQKEIRVVAQEMLELVKSIPENPFQLSLEAFGHA